MTTKKKIVAQVIALIGLATTVLAATTPPRLVERQSPEYSAYARTHQLEGTVVVELVVSENGTVAVADVVDSVHAELDKAALASVKTWKFDPAKQDGKAVKHVVRVPIRFDLVTPEHDHLDPADTSSIAKK